jgi:hypothetical protein
VDGDSFVGNVNSNDGQLKLDRSNGNANSNDGLGLSARQIVLLNPFQNSLSPAKAPDVGAKSVKREEA